MTQQPAVVPGDYRVYFDHIILGPREPDVVLPGHWVQAHPLAHDGILSRDAGKLLSGEFLEAPESARDLGLLPHAELIHSYTKRHPEWNG